jgi:hypothetical protein
MAWPALSGESPAAFAEDKAKLDKPKKNNPSAAKAGIKNLFVCIGEFLLKSMFGCGTANIARCHSRLCLNCITDIVK